MSRKEPRATSEIFLRGFKEPFLRSSGRPFVKLLNWYTGFGKTYTAAAFGIDLFLNCDVIPVFIAPLQSLVAGFSDEVAKHQKQEHGDEIEAAVTRYGHKVPVHRLYSMEYHHNDRTFFRACLSLVAWLEKNPAVCGQLESPNAAGTDKGVRSKLRELRVKAEACESSGFLAMSAGDERFKDAKEAYLKDARKAYGLASHLTEKLIRLDVDTRAQERDDQRYMQVPAVADMVRRLFPLQAFLDRPGIIVCTAAKARVEQVLYTRSRVTGEKKLHRFPNLPEFLEALNLEGSELGRIVSKGPDCARVVTFVDEEEDSYWYLFSSRKSVVNSGGRTDLNIVISQFYQYFDLRWPLAFENRQRSGDRFDLADRVYRSLEDFADISKSLYDELKAEEKKTNAKYVPDTRRVELLRALLTNEHPATAASFKDEEELRTVLTELLDRNDVHKNFKRFRQKAKVLQRMRKYIEEVIPRGGTAYETFRLVHDLVANKKFFTMNRAAYGEVMEQPGQTFFTQSANVMTTDFLKQVELTRDTAHQTIRLVYHDGEVPEGAFTLLHYLKLVVFMAKILSPQGGEDVIEMGEQDVERHPALYRFRSDVRKLFDGRTTEEGLDQETSAEELLTDAFLFEHTKSVVTLEESFTQAEEYNIEADVSLTVTITSLKASPEEDLVKALGRTNGLYLMSATGGLESASSGAFNVRRLKRSLAAKGGHFSEMTPEELAVVSARAREQLALRQRKVTILDDDHPARRFMPSPAFKGLLGLFKDAIPERGEDGYRRLNAYKKDEIEGLVASLDKLLSTDVRSGLVLCQTVGRVRDCLRKLANSDLGLVTEVDYPKGYLFRVSPGALPTYRKLGQTEDIVLVLYKADRFRRTDRSKTGAAFQADDEDGQFSHDLEEALDISSKKVLLWSAYSSASRGINFVTKYKGKKRDFELFCLLNDPYYTHHTRPSGPGFSMEMFQSFSQVMRDRDESEFMGMSKGELLFQYARNRWSLMRKEHAIDITRTVFQALGRGERQPETQMPCQQVLVSSEAARMVHLGLRHAPELAERASPAQRAVLDELKRYNDETSIFPSDQERQKQHQESLKMAVAFRRFTRETPHRFRSDPGARAMWQRLFHPDMFLDPVRYLAGLEKAGVPQVFREGCYLELPVTCEPFKREFAWTAYTDIVVTDAFDGSDTYEWVQDAVRESLRPFLSERARALLKQRRGFALPNGATRLIPQPWFVKEIMKGYIAELEFEEYIATHFNVRTSDLDFDGRQLRFENPSGHEHEAAMYQLYDYYLVPNPDVMVAVDIKNWTRTTDAMKSEELPGVAEEKHSRISALFPEKTVHSLYVNLHGAYKAPANPSKGSIRFMSLFVPGTRGEPWIENTNLREAVLGR